MLPVAIRAADAGPAVDIWVIHGEDRGKLMAKALKVIDANGGFGRDVKFLALKVNAAWAREPEMGACTHPELVTAFIEGVKAAGVSRIEVPENPCNRAEQAFTRSGVEEAVRKAGATMYDMSKEKKFYVDTPVPKGKILTQARVAKQFFEADAVVNMPIAKHHNGATMTASMKNWMGAVEDRRFWHRNGLHQCIADFSTVMKPTWTIVDATRVMLQQGPQGGDLDFLKKPDPNLLIVSRDQVAIDVYATMLFDKTPGDVEYLKMAAELGSGVTDLNQMKIHKIEAAA